TDLTLMSLMKLLLMGRSVDDSRDAPHRYRLCQKSFPPKFGLPKNQSVVDAGEPVVASKALEAAPSKRFSCVIGAAMPQRQPQMVCSPKASLRVRRLPRLDWKRAITFFEKLHFAFRRRISRPRIATVNPNSLQPELSLDAVKVIRNDLNDADLEVVSV